MKRLYEQFAIKELISTDSRNIKPDQIFLPLAGEKFDGHDFINDVFVKGVKHSFCEKNKSSRANEKYKSNLILVENTLDTYHEIANQYRKKINPTVIAITGSSGKTTTKDLLSTVLKTKYKVHKTEANFNNEIGVPKTILEMLEDTQVLVLELAMRQKGEIRYLAKTCEPDIAIITNVGSAHIGRLGSIESVIKAKCEILEHLKKGGLAILHNDPSLVKCSREIWKGKTDFFDLNQAKDISFKEGKSYFVLNEKPSEKYSIPALGKTNVLNSILAIKVARHLSLSTEEVQKGLLLFEIPKGRGNIIKLASDIYVIDESYNANPDSVKTAVSNLLECWDNSYEKILVLGELRELGKHEGELLRDLNSWLTEKPLESLVTVGDKLKEITSNYNVKNISECCDILNKLVKSKSVILVKGSHIAGLEEVINYLRMNHSRL